MIDKFLKIAGVDNMEDFYKLHPTEEHFFKTYPHMRDKVKKGKKIRRPKAAMGGYYQEGGGVDPIQIIQAYAQSKGVDPKQIVAKLQQMAPEEQQAALQQMMQEVQSAMQQGQYRDGGRLPTEVLRSRLESHMSPAEADDYLSTYAQGGRNRFSQEGSQEMMQQLMYGAADNFKKQRSPEQVLKYLQDNGLSEQTSMQMLQQIVNNAEDAGESPLHLPQQQISPMPTGYELRPDYYMGKNEEDYKYNYAAGGGIHINPAKKGTFTAQATRMGMSVKEAARHILAHRDRYSPAMVKKANFARNASNWKHEYGGYTGMYQEGGEAMPQEQMEAPQQQMQEQAMGQEQQPQQGGQDTTQMIQQLAQMVIQALQQGMPPEQIIQMLVQQGIPEEVAMEVVQMVMQQAQGASAQGGPGQQYQPQGGQYQGPQGQQPQAAYGGYYADGGMTGGMFFNQSYMPFDY